MIAADEDALVCDLAETYHILNYRALPVKTLAALSFGLAPVSRSRRALYGGVDFPPEMLLAIIADRLGTLVWMQSEDGIRGINRPVSILDTMTGCARDARSDIETYDSGDAFTAAWQQIAAGGDESCQET